MATRKKATKKKIAKKAKQEDTQPSIKIWDEEPQKGKNKARTVWITQTFDGENLAVWKEKPIYSHENSQWEDKEGKDSEDSSTVDCVICDSSFYNVTEIEMTQGKIVEITIPAHK